MPSRHEIGDYLKKDGNILFLPSLLFILSYLIIAWFNRHAADDFFGIYHVNEKGIWGAFLYTYTNWEGSYAQLLSYYPLSLLFQNSGSLVYFNLLNLLFLIGCFFFFISTLFKLQKIESSPSDRLNIVIIFLSALFISTANISEIWFWLNGSVSYLTPIGFLILGFSFYFRNHYYLAALCIFWFCGFRFNYTLFILILWGFITLFELYKKRSLKATYPLLPIWIAIIAGIVIYLLSPGNSTRKSALVLATPFEGGISSALEQLKYFSQCLFIRLPYFLVLVLPLLVWFYKRKITLRLDKEILFLSLIFIIAFLGIHFGLMSFIYQRFWFGEIRTWFIIQLFLYPLLILLLTPFLKRWILTYSTFALSMGLILTILIYSIKIIPAIPSLKKYASSYDQRIEYLQHLKSNYQEFKSDTIQLTALPRPSPDFVNNENTPEVQCKRFKYVLNGKLGYLRYEDITNRTSPQQWINEGIEKAMNLPFHIDLSQEK
jgi:hypothetical protein